MSYWKICKKKSPVTEESRARSDFFFGCGIRQRFNLNMVAVHLYGKYFK